MGVIFASEACETCGYTPHGRLFYSGGKVGFFRGLATCHTCHEIVSIYPDEAHIPPDFMLMYGGAAVYEIHVADMMARLKLDLPPVNTCPICGGHDLTHHDIWEAFAAKQPIQIPCPRSEIGHVVLTRAGMWD